MWWFDFFCPQTNSEFRKDRKVQPRNPNPGTVFIPQILKTRYFTLTHLGWESSLYVSLGSFQGADSQTSMTITFYQQSSTFTSHIEEEAMSLSVFYCCICDGRCYCCGFKYPSLCHLLPFHLAYFACWNFTLVGPH